MQDENITKQLNAGVRYFDLRIARKPNDHNPTRLYFYHGLYTHTNVEVKAEMADVLKKKEKRRKKLHSQSFSLSDVTDLLLIHQREEVFF